MCWDKKIVNAVEDSSEWAVGREVGRIVIKISVMRNEGRKISVRYIVGRGEREIERI